MLPLLKTKIFFWALIFLNITAVVFYVFFNASLNGKTEKVNILAADLQSENEKEAKFNLAKQTIKNMSGDYKEIDSCFVSENGVVDFIREIETAAGKAGVELKINRVDTDDSKSLNKGIIETLSIEFNIEGKWDNSFYFLSLVELIPYHITIENVFMDKDFDILGKSEKWKSVFLIKVPKIASKI